MLSNHFQNRFRILNEEGSNMHDSKKENVFGECFWYHLLFQVECSWDLCYSDKQFVFLSLTRTLERCIYVLCFAILTI